MLSLALVSAKGDPLGAKILCPLAEGGGMVDGHGMDGLRRGPFRYTGGKWIDDETPKDTSYMALVSDTNACEVKPGATKGNTASWTLLKETDLSACPQKFACIRTCSCRTYIELYY